MAVLTGPAVQSDEDDLRRQFRPQVIQPARQLAARQVIQRVHGRWRPPDLTRGLSVRPGGLEQLAIRGIDGHDVVPLCTQRPRDLAARRERHVPLSARPPHQHRDLHEWPLTIRIRARLGNEPHRSV